MADGWGAEAMADEGSTRPPCPSVLLLAMGFTPSAPGVPAVRVPSRAAPVPSPWRAPERRSDGWGDGGWGDGGWGDGGWDDGSWGDGGWGDGGWGDGSWDGGGWDDGSWDGGAWDDGGWDGGGCCDCGCGETTMSDDPPSASKENLQFNEKTLFCSRKRLLTSDGVYGAPRCRAGGVRFLLAMPVSARPDKHEDPTWVACSISDAVFRMREARATQVCAAQGACRAHAG